MFVIDFSEVYLAKSLGNWICKNSAFSFSFSQSSTLVKPEQLRIMSGLKFIINS
jgi:hypothetical protein